MKKIIPWIVIIITVLLVGILPDTVAAAEPACPYCGRTESQWIELTSSTDRFLTAAHYYLAEDVSISKQLVQETEGVSCIDLSGNKLTSGARVIQVGEDSTTPSVTVNILDSVGGGILQGSGSSHTSWSAGVIYQEPGSVINVYSGTITTKDPAQVSARKGGIATVMGTFNVYGGQLLGGTVSGYGATLWCSGNGTVRLAGGQVRSGTAPEGECVYIDKNAKAILTGAAQVDAIAFVGSSAECLTVEGTFTGTAVLRIPAENGAVIAAADNAVITGSITVADSDLTAVVSGEQVVMGEGSWCEACEKNVIWQELSGTLPKTATGHWRLSANVSAAQVTLANNATVCLDLNGYSYNGTGRALILGTSNGACSDIFNLMDSSGEKTGRFTGCGGSAAMAGGVIYSYKNTTVNLYDVTVEARGIGDVIAKYGGAIDTYGTVNMYGGTVIGDRVAYGGGTVCLLSSAAVFNMESGTLVSGKADEQGDCLYAFSNATVKLSGDATVPEIYFAGSSASKLIISGDYTGTASLRFATTPAANADIGNCNNATIGKESITIAGTRMVAAVSGTNLVAHILTGAAVEGTDNVRYYQTVAEAVAAWRENDDHIRLLSDSGETLRISAAIKLDLCGWDITGDISTEDTLQVFDSATDDYVINDGVGYGRLTGRLAGNIIPAEGYLPLTDTGRSFHRYTLRLRSVNLRPQSAEIYFGSDILADEAILAQTARFGIAVSTNNETPTARPDDTESRYTAFSPEDYGDRIATSVIITGIMDGGSFDAVNAATPIYGCPYLLLKDGTYLYGRTCAATLQQLTELVDSSHWEQLTITQNRALHSMYGKYEEAMSDWTISNLKTAAAAAKQAEADGVLKAIIIGNSDSTDATNLLYEIFLAEGWSREQLVLGCMYESGCAIDSHVKFALNDMPEYKYYKNTGSNADGTWDCRENSTLKYALQDEDWDIVILQESNSVSGVSDHFADNPNVEKLITYVVNTVGYEPRLLWHFVGANPQIPQAYMDYVNSLEDADGDNSDASENEDWEDTGASEPEDMAWIFDIARPTMPVSWAKRYQNYWNNDREIMYNAIAANVRDHILGRKVYGFEGVIPSATSFQYAINTLGMTEQDMYRDYTHKSDYGRMMVSYVWYATLTGQETLEDIRFTTVPANLRQKKFVQYGDLILTEHQIDVLLQSVNFALRSPLEAPVP